MYGLVNEAIRDLVIRSHGEDAWARVAALAGTQTFSFVSMCPYDDRVSFALVDAASAVLGLPAATVLERFGEHWITITAARDFGPLLDFCGRTFAEFIDQLGTIHGRMKLAFPSLEPPTLSCVHLAPGLVRVDYASHRQGLAPLVVGLLRGLGTRFGIRVNVEQIAERARDGRDQFLVSSEEALA